MTFVERRSWGGVVGADLWDLLRGHALSCGPCAQRFARPMLLAVSGLALKLAGTFVMESQEMTYIPRLSTNFIVTLIGLVLSSKALLVYGYLEWSKNSNGLRWHNLRFPRFSSNRFAE